MPSKLEVEMKRREVADARRAEAPMREERNARWRLFFALYTIARRPQLYGRLLAFRWMNNVAGAHDFWCRCRQ